MNNTATDAYFTSCEPETVQASLFYASCWHWNYGKDEAGGGGKGEESFHFLILLRSQVA